MLFFAIFRFSFSTLKTDDRQKYEAIFNNSNEFPCYIEVGKSLLYQTHADPFCNSMHPCTPPSLPHSRLFPSSTSSIQKLSYYQLVRKLMCKSNTYFSLDVSLIQILASGSLQMLKHFSRNATNSKRKTKNLGHEKSEKFRRGIHKVVSEINARETKLSKRMSDYSDKKKKFLLLNTDL